MRCLAVAGLSATLALAACHEPTAGDAVRDQFENKADAIDAAATRQPTDTARKIYESRAAAIREEGEDRKKGLEGREPSSGQGAASNGG